MAEKIELQIVADNSQYISSTKQVEQATISMQRTVQAGEKRQKGLIEDTTEALKEYEEQRKKAYNYDDLSKANKKIAEAKKTLKEYHEVGVQSTTATQQMANATSGLWTAFKRLIAPILAVTTVVKGLKAIFASTQQAGDFLRREIQGIKVAGDTLARAIATWNFEKIGERLRGARDAGREYADELDHIGDLEREIQIREARRNIILADLMKIYRDTALQSVEANKKRADAAEEYIRIATEGEEETLGLLKLKLEAELRLAREQAGFTKEYANASKERQTAIDEEIKGNLTMESTFEKYKTQITGYQDILKNIKTLGPIWKDIDVQAAIDMFTATGKLTDEIKRLPPAAQTMVKTNLETIAKMPPNIREVADQFLTWGLVTDEVRSRIATTITTIEQKQADLVRGTIRANTAMELANYQAANIENKTNEDRLKQAEKFSAELLKLWDEYNKKRIESLTGVEQIEAEEAFTIELINNEQKKLEELGELNEEGIKMLEALRLFAHQKALRDIRDYNAEQLAAWEDTYREAGDKLIDSLDFRKDLELQALELSGKATEKKRLEIENKYLAAQRDLYLKAGAMYDPMMAQWIQGLIDANEKVIEGSGFNFWEAIGLGDNPEAQDAIKEGIKAMTDALDEIFEARVQDTERTRELLDTQISETQQALEAEMQLMQSGYANNVELKRKELEALKVEREKALKEEEKALQAQRALDTATQISSLITASANIIKGYSKLPIIGQILAIAAIAAMWGTFAAAKTKAAAVTKLAEGGVGTVAGRSHAEGGEPFLNHVEVERGEMWGVLSKNATQKYGKAFNKVVTSFNKDKMPVMEPAFAENNILVDVNQTNTRLDKVEFQLVKLNKHFASEGKVIETATARIEKRGNKTRIVRKNV